MSGDSQSAASVVGSSTWVGWLEDEHSWLHGYAQRLLRREGGRGLDTEDLVQEVQARGLRKRSEVRFGGRGDMRSWLATVARNLLRDLGRRRRPGPLTDGGDQQDPVASPDVLLLRASLSAHLQERLDALPGVGAEVVRLRIWEELSFAEVGERLGIGEGAARTQFHRSLARLRGDRRIRDSM
jgi:RNA polymerase sigma factor (sigma-70 family)